MTDHPTTYPHVVRVGPLKGETDHVTTFAGYAHLVDREQSTTSMTQTSFQFDTERETQAERCRRVLGMVRDVRKASEFGFTESAAREASELARADRSMDPGKYHHE